MLESVIMLLIQICVVALVIYLIIWVLGQLGLGLPPMVVKILYVIGVLIVILLLFRMLGPTLRLGGYLPIIV